MAIFFGMGLICRFSGLKVRHVSISNRRIYFIFEFMAAIAQTPRLIIREFLPDEETIYLNHFNDEMVTQYIPKRSREERINIFQRGLEQYATSKTTGLWGIFSKAGGDFIGSCLLRPFYDEAGVLELGYSLEKKYWGDGFATEMATVMVAHGLSDPNISEIVAVTELENVGSQRVLEKAGFKRMDNLLRNGEELAYFNTQRLSI
jgi:ribosomal-protein-alanine N-acetyltransferase